MTITQTLTTLDPTPDLADLGSFETRMNTLLTLSLPRFRTEMNTLIGQFNTDLTSINYYGSIIDANLATIVASPGLVAASNATLAQVAGFAQTATAQAAAAVAAAASAASVAQQDLSGVTNAGLHFTPNAIVDTVVYDTSRDSDGGAWRQRCLSQSWVTEPLAGPWLAADTANGIQSELQARCVGATRGADTVTNGNFDAGLTGWTDASTAPATLTWDASGRARLTRTDTNNARMDQAVPTTAGSLHELNITVSDAVSGQIQVLVTTAAGGTGTQLLASPALSNGFHRLYFVATGATSFVRVITAAVGAPAVDGVAVRPITQLNVVSGSYYNLATDGRHYALSRNLFRNSVWAGGTGALGSFPTGWGLTGAQPNVVSVAQETVNGTQTGVVRLRRIAATGTEGIQQTLATSMWPTAFGARVLVRVPTGVTAADLLFWDGSTSSNIASAATLNAQPKDVWVAYPVSHTPSATRTIGGFGLASAAVGTGVDLAMPSLEIGAVTGYEATTSQEVTRGNTREFPALPIIAVEANSVTIYAGDLPGRPMWMRFQAGSANNAIRVGTSISAVAMRDGELLVGVANAAGDLNRINFIRDDALTLGTTASYRYLGNIAQRNAGLTHALIPGPYIASRWVNAVAVTVRPQAPTDPTTGLPVPTIGVAVGTGSAGQVGTVLMDDGSAVNYSQASNDGAGVAFTSRGDVVWSLSNSASVVALPLATNNVASVTAASGARVYTSGAAPSVSTGNGKRLTIAGRQLAVMQTSTNRVTVLRENSSTPAAGLACDITGTHNTGWMTGDIRRCLLAEITAGAQTGGTIADRSVSAAAATVNGTITFTPVAAGAQLVMAGGWSALNYLSQAYSAQLDPGTGPLTVSLWGTIPTNVSAAGWAVERGAASGAYYRLGHTATGQIVAEVSDGTTVRTVTSTQTYATGLPIKARLNWTGPGAALELVVNGVRVGRTIGPLGTLTNASATLTVGIDRALSAPWAGGLAWVKLGMTVPTAEQAAFMYGQELALMQPGAQAALSDAGAVLRVRYCDMTDRLLVATAANADVFQGLRRVSSTASAGGSYVTGDVGGAGLTVLARNNGGARQVAVSIPARNLQAEMYRRAEDAARLARLPVTRDADAFAFTASVTSGSNVITVTGGSVVGTPFEGACIDLAGVPAGTTIQTINGLTYYLSAAATATSSSTALQRDVLLPAGHELVSFSAGRQLQREGATRDYQRVFDGFVERVRTNTGQAGNTWLQTEFRRIA